MLKSTGLFWNISMILSLTRSIRYLLLLLMMHILGLLSLAIIISQFRKCCYVMSTQKILKNKHRLYLCKLDDTLFKLSFVRFVCASIYHKFTGIPFRCLGSYVY